MNITRWMPMVRNVLRVGAGVVLGTSLPADQMIETVATQAMPEGANTEQIIAGFIAWALVELWYYLAKRWGWRT